jgi:hypothetical protein
MERPAGIARLWHQLVTENKACFKCTLQCVPLVLTPTPSPVAMGEGEAPGCASGRDGVRASSEL